MSSMPIAIATPTPKIDSHAAQCEPLYCPRTTRASDAGSVIHSRRGIRRTTRTTIGRSSEKATS